MFLPTFGWQAVDALAHLNVAGKTARLDQDMTSWPLCYAVLWFLQELGAG